MFYGYHEALKNFLWGVARVLTELSPFFSSLGASTSQATTLMLGTSGSGWNEIHSCWSPGQDGPQDLREEEPCSGHLLHITCVAPRKRCLNHFPSPAEGSRLQKENHFILLCFSLRNSGMLDSQCGMIAKWAWAGSKSELSFLFLKTVAHYYPGLLLFCWFKRN